jgi:hypothetical protein
LAGLKHSNTQKWYLSYASTIHPDPNPAGSNVLTMGSYTDITEKITLIPHVSFTELKATNSASAQKQINIDIASDIKISTQSYIIPSISFYQLSGRDNSNGLHENTSDIGKILAISGYHLF